MVVGLDGYGGASDVDSLIMRRTFLSTGTPQTEENRWYVLQNWRQDVSVILDEAGVQRERAHFSPYGRVFGMPAGDTNFDGMVCFFGLRQMVGMGLGVDSICTESTRVAL